MSIAAGSIKGKMSFSSTLFSWFSHWPQTHNRAEPAVQLPEVVVNNDMEIEVDNTDAINADPICDTPLHNIIRNCRHINAVYEFIRNNIKEAAAMSRTVNNHGELPYDLVLSMPFAYRDCEKLRRYLLSLMISQRQLMMPSEILDFTEIKRQHQALENNHLYHHLQLGVKAANHVRSIIWESSTHLHTNSYKTSLRKSIHQKVVKVRTESLISNDEADNICALAERYHAGNCYEYAVLAKNYLLNQDLNIPIELVEISNGDHIFVVIGRNPKSEVGKYLGWGREAVICDPWAGDVYPVSQIENKLKTYRQIEQYRVIMKFNPRFHELALHELKFKYDIKI